MRAKNYYLWLSLVFAALAFTLTGCGDQNISSKWRTQNLTIDGNDSDWGNSLTFYDKLNALVGVENDDKFLYLCLVTTDQQLQSKILRMGLTVWFDKTGNNDKKFGIKFPLGFSGMNRQNFTGERFNPEQSQRPNPQEINDRILKNQTDMEFVGAKNEEVRLPVAQLKGVELKLGLKDGRFVYEMRVPLSHAGGYDYAISADTGSVVSVGLETGKMNFDRSENRGFGRSRGGEGGFGGGMEGGDDFGGGMGGGREGYERARNLNPSALQQLDFWAEIKLASSPAN